MTDTNDVLDPGADAAPPAPRPKAEPIDSRFLFVDVAALRAKQLRRGALPRLDEVEEQDAAPRVRPVKSERVAMEEVKRNLVLYDVTQPPKPTDA
jgi:DNA-directed RNA polymerase subunit K/omega